MQYWLSGGSNATATDAVVAEHIIQAAHVKLKDAVRRNFEDPKAHLQSFSQYQTFLRTRCETL